MDGPKSDPPIPIFTTCVIAFPEYPFHSPEITLLQKEYIFSWVALISGITSTPSIISGELSRLLRAVCKTARFSVSFILAPEN